jgi:hypothetical protein
VSERKREGERGREREREGERGREREREGERGPKNTWCAKTILCYT